MKFHNTIEATGQQLLNFEAQAITGEELVMEAFNIAKCPLAWFEVKAFLWEEMNECSLKRAITNLKDKGKLEKTNELVTGIYSKPCHRYKLITK